MRFSPKTTKKNNMKYIAYASSRPVTTGVRRPPKIYFAIPGKCVGHSLKIWTLSENSSPTLVSQAGYGAGFKIFF